VGIDWGIGGELVEACPRRRDRKPRLVIAGPPLYRFSSRLCDQLSTASDLKGIERKAGLSSEVEHTLHYLYCLDNVALFAIFIPHSEGTLEHRGRQHHSDERSQGPSIVRPRRRNEDILREVTDSKNSIRFCAKQKRRPELGGVWIRSAEVVETNPTWNYRNFNSCSRGRADRACAAAPAIPAWSSVVPFDRGS
jgi:hypothetical protein